MTFNDGLETTGVKNSGRHFQFTEENGCQKFYHLSIKYDLDLGPKIQLYVQHLWLTQDASFFKILVGWMVVLGFKATLTAKVISWRSVMHLCFLAFSYHY